MAPKWYNVTPFRFRKLRRAALAAFFALAPVPTIEASVPLALSTQCPAARPSLPAIDFDLTSEDARITCHNTRRGTTCEFLVSTSSYGDLAGKRIVSVLEGERWVGFAFADDFGLHVWTRLRGGSSPSKFERFAAFLEDMAAATAKGVVIVIERFS